MSPHTRTLASVMELTGLPRMRAQGRVSSREGSNRMPGQSGPVSVVPAGPSAAGRRFLRSAGISVALIPVAFVVGMLVGEGLLATQGIEPGSAEFPPVGATLLAAIPALLILITPAIFAIVLGSRARRQG